MDEADGRMNEADGRMNTADGRMDAADAQVGLLRAKVELPHMQVRHQRLRTLFVVFMCAVVLFGMWRTQQVATQIRNIEATNCQSRKMARAYIRTTIAREAVDWSAADQAEQDAVFAPIHCPGDRR